MVLALQYMQRTGTARPETRARFLEKIEIGYRRLLGFEVASEPGGFDWWGRPPANLFLTAYGLMEFRNLSEVAPIDPTLIPRIVRWLRSRQQEDGSWSPDGVPTGWSTDMAQGRSFYLTAYVAWGLARAGQPDARALAWLAAHDEDAEDPYGLALAALAFLQSDPDAAEGRALVDRLVRMQAHDEAGPHWVPEHATGVGARGTSAAIETTALAIHALVLDGRHTGLMRRAVSWLLHGRGADGRFGTTQSTILALEALCAADDGRAPTTGRTARVRAGAGAPVPVSLPPDTTEPRSIDLPPGDGEVVLELEGEGQVRATVARTAWLPWDDLGPGTGPLSLRVRYPDGPIEVGRRAEAVVEIENTSPRQGATVVTIEVGIPPGCTVVPEEVEAPPGRAEHVELGERHVVIYLRELAPLERLRFVVPFTPRYGLAVHTAPSKAYEYYVPEERSEVAPASVRTR